MNRATSPIKRLTACLLAGALVLSACSKGDNTAAAPASTAGAVPQASAATLPPPPPPQEPPPAPTEDAAAWTPDALDEVLAPIALYPDTILAQVLAASTNAQEVLDAGNWLLQNQTLKEDALTKAAAAAGFSPSMQALVHFPTVVDMMCQELDWTKQLGDAFTADQPAVLASVQRLRKQAKEAGNLVSNPQMKVETTEQNGKEVIIVQPANPQVIYVPQYNPSEAYAPAPAAAPATTTTTTTTESSGISTETAVLGGLLAFGAGVLVGNAFDDDDDNYCYPNWGYGGVYYGGHPYGHNTFVYAPNYNGYRPAYGYNRPANYPARYNNNNFQRNSVNNINVNSNNNYMNKFDKNQNRVSNYQAKSPVSRQNAAATDRPRGSTSYAGAQRPGNTAAGGAAAGTRPSAGQSARPSTGQARPSGQYAGAKPSTGQAGASQRPASASQRPASTQQRAVPDRGYPQTSGKRPDATASSRGGEFNGGGNQQASRDRAASQRGKSSMSSAPRPSSQRSGGGGGGRGGGGGGGGGGRGGRGG